MEIKKTKNFTELGWKTTATLAQNEYSIDSAVAIGQRIEIIGRYFVGRECDENCKTMQFMMFGVVIVDVNIKIRNGTLTAINCIVYDLEGPIKITPKLVY